MLNEKKIEEIRAKIQASALLTDREKSDWLNLLELMNDKQLGELEEILGAESSAANSASPAVPAEKLGGLADKTMPVYNKTSSFPAAAAAAAAASANKPAATPMAPPSGMPPLTHIANIPTDIAMARSSAPASSPASPAVPAKNPTNQPKPSKPAGVPAAAPAPAHSGVTQPRLKFESIEDVQSLSLDALRSYDLQSVVDALREQIVAHGYFSVLQLLEHSPLYDSYINSGKERLKESGNTISDSSLLTQDELEFMTDLLMHMRFNRW